MRPGCRSTASRPGPVVGGLWRFENPNGLSGAYSTLEMNTSGPRMSYSDFPFGSDDYPPHPVRRRLLRSLRRPLRLPRRRSASTHGWSESNNSRTGPRRSRSRAREPRAGARYATYDALLVCNGHHWDPRWPEPPFPGRFGGARDALARLPAPRGAGRPAGGGSGRRQQRRRHRPRRQPGRGRAYLSLRRGVHVLRKRLGRKRNPDRSDCWRRRGCRGR